MKGVILTVVLFTTIATALDVIELFSGDVVPLGPYNTTVSLGSISPKYPMLTHDDVIATGNAFMLFHMLKKMHRVGIYPLPPIDPYTKNYLAPLHFNDKNFLAGNVTFSALKLTGAKYSALNSLEIRMKRDRTDFVNLYPVLNVETDFYADLLMSRIIPVKLRGHLRVQCDSVGISGALQATKKRLNGYGRKVVYEVTGAKLYFQAKNVAVRFTNTALGNDLIQSLSTAQNNHALGDSLAVFRKALDKYILILYVQQINSIMKSLSSEQVLAYLLPTY